MDRSIFRGFPLFCLLGLAIAIVIVGMSGDFLVTLKKESENLRTFAFYFCPLFMFANGIAVSFGIMSKRTAIWSAVLALVVLCAPMVV